VDKIYKIIEKMRNSLHGHKFEDCEKVLLYLGFKMKEAKGSHFKFIKTDLQRPIVIAKHRPLAPGAVKDVLNAFDTFGGKHE